LHDVAFVELPIVVIWKTVKNPVKLAVDVLGLDGMPAITTTR
jgi:hypothetical protein